MKQLQFDKIPKRKTFFGGSLLKKSHAKTARPLSTKLPIHLVLKSSHAKGVLSFLKPRHTKCIKILLRKTSRLFRIQILEFSINSNHIHLLIRGHRREDMKNFMRTLSALIPRYVQNRHKATRSNSNRMNENENKAGGFWNQRPFTRIVESYRGYFITKDYILLNHLEALGVVPYTPRKSFYSSA